ncbi:hypothetical protein ABPG72_002701 [Tetrahymena utriculariae]
MGKQQLIILSSSEEKPKQYGLQKIIQKKDGFALPLNKKRFQKLEIVARELEEIYKSMICSNQSFTCLSTKSSIESFDKCPEDKCLSIQNDEDNDEEIYSSFDLE